MILVESILAGLAGFRLALMLVDEGGPGDIFARLRAWAGVPDGPGEMHPRPFVGGLLSCVWCASVWTTGGAFALGAIVSWTPVAIVAAMGIAVLAKGAAK